MLLLFRFTSQPWLSLCTYFLVLYSIFVSIITWVAYLVPGSNRLYSSTRQYTVSWCESKPVTVCATKVLYKIILNMRMTLMDKELVRKSQIFVSLSRFYNLKTIFLRLEASDNIMNKANVARPLAEFSLMSIKIVHMLASFNWAYDCSYSEKTIKIISNQTMRVIMLNCFGGTKCQLPRIRLDILCGPKEPSKILKFDQC